MFDSWNFMVSLIITMNLNSSSHRVHIINRSSINQSNNYKIYHFDYNYVSIAANRTATNL